MVILRAVLIAFQAEPFFAFPGDWAGAAGAGEGGADEPGAGSLERPSEKRDLNVRDADIRDSAPATTNT